MPSLVGIFLVLEAILACLALVLRMPLPAIIVLCAWGACSFSACAVLQARVVEQAQEGPNLASTLNISAFNLGNAFGAKLGGWAPTMDCPLPGFRGLQRFLRSGLLRLQWFQFLKSREHASLTLRHLKAQFSRDEATEDFPMLATL
jgi:hypothetical protein